MVQEGETTRGADGRWALPGAEEGRVLAAKHSQWSRSPQPPPRAGNHKQTGPPSARSPARARPSYLSADAASWPAPRPPPVPMPLRDVASELFPMGPSGHLPFSPLPDLHFERSPFPLLSGQCQGLHRTTSFERTSDLVPRGAEVVGSPVKPQCLPPWPHVLAMSPANGPPCPGSSVPLVQGPSPD